jgi:hypothetical protein
MHDDGTRTISDRLRSGPRGLRFGLEFILFYFNKTIFGVGRHKQPPPLSISLLSVHRLATSKIVIFCVT